MKTHDDRLHDGSIANFESLAENVGNTPLRKMSFPYDPQTRLLVKLEGNNPTGSVKDRACLAMFRSMLQDPVWNAGKIIIDASSGNMGCSIAYFGRALGVDVRIISSRKLTPEKRCFIEYFGASVETVGEFTIEANDRCREIALAQPDKWYFLDQLHNPANPMAHFAGTGPEILVQVPQVSAVVGSIGSGGTLLGIGRYLKQSGRRVRIFAVEAAAGTRLPGTAALADGDYRTSFIEEGFADKIFDASVQVSEDEAIEMARRISATGIFGGLQTYGVLVAAERIIETYDLHGDVVAISGDTGWKNMDVLAQKVLGHAGSSRDG